MKLSSRKQNKHFFVKAMIMIYKKKNPANLFRLKNVHICTYMYTYREKATTGQDIHVLCKLTPF